MQEHRKHARATRRLKSVLIPVCLADPSSYTETTKAVVLWGSRLFTKSRRRLWIQAIKRVDRGPNSPKGSKVSVVSDLYLEMQKSNLVSSNLIF